VSDEICGHDPGGPTHTLPTSPPFGWVATPLTDGSIRVKQRTWNRLIHSGHFMGTLFLLGVVLIIQATPNRYYPLDLVPEGGWISLVPFLALEIIAVLNLVWLLLETAHWRIAPGVLEVHRGCLGRRWVTRFTQAELLVRCEWSHSGRQRHRVCRLVARELGKDTVLTETTVAGAFQLHRLGSYLSTQTGWPLQLPTVWPPATCWGCSR